MSIYQKVLSKTSFNNYDLIIRDNQSRWNNETSTSIPYVNLIAGDQVMLEDSYQYYIDSCASYAIRNNNCPIEAYNRAVKLGQETHWINIKSTCISDQVKERCSYIQCDLKTIYKFEGKFFRIVKTNNHNLAFTSVNI